MEFPLFRNPWSDSTGRRYEQSLKGIPVQIKPKAMPPQPLKPKVVSIPVHFVGLGRSRSESVIKIQKVFRGFLVRKNMKKIKAMREEVNDIERSVSKKETVNLIRNDSKERLKVNEMLMSLLLKLDSVRGVDSGVRDFRKSVIKKAIALQELVDAIVSGDHFIDSNDAEVVDQNQAVTDSADNYDQTLETENHAEITNDAEVIDQSQGIADSADDCNQTLESQNHAEITDDAEFVPNLTESEVIMRNYETVESDKQVGTHQEGEQSTETSGNGADSSANETCKPDDRKEGNDNENSSRENCGDDDRSEKLLERMVEDNEKMMGMIAMLFERNEMQSQMLNALSLRLEQLEKALSKRKKRRNVAGCGDGAKKCGKR